MVLLATLLYDVHVAMLDSAYYFHHEGLIVIDINKTTTEKEISHPKNVYIKITKCYYYTVFYIYILDEYMNSMVLVGIFF